MLLAKIGAEEAAWFHALLLDPHRGVSNCGGLASTNQLPVKTAAYSSPLFLSPHICGNVPLLLLCKNTLFGANLVPQKNSIKLAKTKVLDGSVLKH